MRTLLLADDSVTVQRVIALTFADEPISVVTCADGRQAMERMTAQRPDIVLAGTTLPQVSGYDLARFMRSTPELRDVPVLLLTGAFETVDEARLESSGANGVIEKPVEPNNVIGRVKELLGLKSDEKPATAGRLVTSADSPGKKLPVATPPRAVMSTRGTPSKWEQLRNQTGLDADTRSVEDASTRPEDYLDTLDAAFDTLDQQLSGRAASATPSRNPSGPLGQASGAADPRSPGRSPLNTGASAPGNPVFEVDDEWFGGEDSAARADARAGRRDLQEDLRHPELQAPAAEAAPPVFEVDDDWFAEDNKARAARQIEQRVLAAEMGIHEVELPQAAPVPNAPAPPSDLDFDFGLDDIKKLQEGAPAPAVAEPAPAPLAPAAPVASVAPVATFAPAAPVVPAASASASSRDVAMDFAQLLAFEQGEHHEPPMVAPPEITEAMLGDIVTRVTERLNTGAFIEQLRSAMTATVADAAREVAAATSERLVREIATSTSERLVREIAAATSERIVREIAPATSERVARDIATETSERLAREIATETSERLVRGIVSETSERLVRDEIERIKNKPRP